MLKEVRGRKEVGSKGKLIERKKGENVREVRWFDHQLSVFLSIRAYWSLFTDI